MRAWRSRRAKPRPRASESPGASSFLPRQVAGDLLDLLVGVALGELVHDRRRPLAFLELAHALHDQVFRQPGKRNDFGGGAAAVGAVAVGAGGGEAARLLPGGGEGRAQQPCEEQALHVTLAASSSKRSWTFSSASTSMVTLPPCCRRPNSSSSASARRIVSWISRAMARPPISGAKPFLARCSFSAGVKLASTFFSASCSSS